MLKAQIEGGALKTDVLLSLIAAILILCLGTWLRFHRIDAQSLWYDEGNTAQMTFRASGDITRAAGADIHPPGYYLAVTGWSRMAGSSEFALRAFSAFAGIALLGFLYTLGKEYWGSSGGLIAAFLGAVHPALVYYSQEARMYMLATVLGSVSVLLCGRLVGRYGISRDRKLCYAYMMVAAVGIYIHYTFSFLLFAINIAILWRIWQSSTIKTGPAIIRWSMLQFGALLLYIPWLPTAIRHITTWPAARTEIPALEAGAQIWHWLALGPTIEMTEAVAGTAGILVLAAVGMVLGRSMVASLWLIVPAVLMLTLGLFGEAFAKFLLLSVPATALLAAGGTVSLVRDTRANARVIAVLILSPVLWFTGTALVNLYTNPEFYRDNYRTIAADLYKAHHPGDAILLNAPNQVEVFSYYYPDLDYVFPVARARPLDVEEQHVELARIAEDHRRLTVLYWGETQADPGMVVERWLNEHTYKTGSQWYGQVRVATYSVTKLPVSWFEGPGTRFANAIELRAYSLGPENYAPGDVVQVTLLWVPLVMIDEDYTVFVHLYSQSDVPPIAQHDGAPVGGSEPTGRWQIGVEVVDRHGLQLPENITPGEYTVAVGFYSADYGRLDVNIENTKDGRLVLGTITVIE
ncbi:MAG: glycosyltransferase family 39 protein [Anaerolineales bacterium]|nr:glycosyltransferase family 39 protein [Anaerolineales bacterium]